MWAPLQVPACWLLHCSSLYVCAVAARHEFSSRRRGSPNTVGRRESCSRERGRPSGAGLYWNA
eukprot:913657-Pyramimonas_sp.AAC.1